ncbi:hypothetical protein L1787_16405 [Acuticoccus sp. M5D2P5]|uniref:hypothetical protein n=1 Tax=Acuticoccus kalidii TaxID=2910977 RepID=UPI001F342246|nr:hypothetical protein [Acuticoccus kalidii]MCF3934988.1 hypothetical protein [Acuticoccus kalidii]
MTDAETREVREELRDFKSQWHAAQEKRARDFWTSFRWVVGLGASLLVSFLLWAWYVTTGAGDGKEAVIRVEAVQKTADANAQALEAMRLTIDKRSGHETRITVLEDRYGRIENSLEAILKEVRQGP